MTKLDQGNDESGLWEVISGSHQQTQICWVVDMMCLTCQLCCLVVFPPIIEVKNQSSCSGNKRLGGTHVPLIYYCSREGISSMLINMYQFLSTGQGSKWFNNRFQNRFLPYQLGMSINRPYTFDKGALSMKLNTTSQSLLPIHACPW